MPHETLPNSAPDNPNELPLTAADRADLVLLETAKPGEIESLVADGGVDRTDTAYMETPNADVFQLVANGKNLARVRLADTAPAQEHFAAKR